MLQNIVQILEIIAGITVIPFAIIMSIFTIKDYKKIKKEIEKKETTKTDPDKQ